MVQIIIGSRPQYTSFDEWIVITDSKGRKKNFDLTESSSKKIRTFHACLHRK